MVGFDDQLFMVGPDDRLLMEGLDDQLLMVGLANQLHVIGVDDRLHLNGLGDQFLTVRFALLSCILCVCGMGFDDVLQIFGCSRCNSSFGSRICS